MALANVANDLNASAGTSLSPLSTPAASSTPGPNISDILGSFANYNAITGPPLPGSEATNPGGFFPGGQGLVPGGSPSPYLPAPPAPTSTPAPPLTNATPTVGSLLNSDPAYLAALARQQMGIAANDSALNQARQQAIINFGDPALAQLAGFGIDPQAAAFARTNYLSGNATLARLNHAHSLAQQAIINQLAAHGLLNSGELGWEQGEENQNYGNSVYDAQQAVLQRLTDLYNSYLSSNSSLEDQVNTAMESALSNFIANPDAYATFFGGSPSSSTSSTTTTSPTVTTPKKSKTSVPADALSRYLANQA